MHSLPAGTVAEQDPLEQAALVLGLRPRWRHMTSKHGLVAVSECELVDTGGTAVSGASGTGKGATPAQAQSRALAEALERHLTGPVHLERQAVHFITARELAAGELSQDASSPLLAQLEGGQLACHTYQSLHGGHEVSIPVYLRAPWFAGHDGKTLREKVGDRTDYRALARYAVNSGYGLAPTLAQATLHALLETVERDACSLLTIRTFLSGQPPTLLDPQSLPDDLAALHAHAQREAGTTVHLIDATSELEIPTVVAYCLPIPGRPYLRGQAAALSPDAAVTGALRELLESVVARQHGALPHSPSLRTLEPYPALHRCARFDFTNALAHARTTAFCDRPASPQPQAQVDETLARLAAHGFTAYRLRITDSPRGVSTVHTMVPGMERFFAIVKGALIVPGPRGRAWQHPT